MVQPQPQVVVEGVFDLDAKSYSVTRDAVPVTVLRSQGVSRLKAGFEWGTIGSGSSQLAIELMLEAGATDIEANEFQGRFKREVVGRWSASGGFSITIDELEAFLATYRYKKALE